MTKPQEGPHTGDLGDKADTNEDPARRVIPARGPSLLLLLLLLLLAGELGAQRALVEEGKERVCRIARDKRNRER